MDALHRPRLRRPSLDSTIKARTSTQLPWISVRTLWWLGTYLCIIWCKIAGVDTAHLPVQTPRRSLPRRNRSFWRGTQSVASALGHTSKMRDSDFIRRNRAMRLRASSKYRGTDWLVASAGPACVASRRIANRPGEADRQDHAVAFYPPVFL